MASSLLADWEDLAPRFKNTLLLGNGASRAVSPSFSYDSLFQCATANGLITPNVKSVFDHLDTADFELVLRMLWHAQRINLALGLDDDLTEPTYKELRTALITTVQELHVDYGSAHPYLRSIARFMGGFDKVLSLNYDLIVYWALLVGNDEERGRFKDCWLNGVFDGDWERLKEPMYGMDCTLVFYPHGNLILTTSPASGESKLTRAVSGYSLLADIVDSWTRSDLFPLFVSEGEATQKEAAIARSGYLTTVYNDVMRNLGERIAVYGWALSDNDTHILRRLCSRKTREIAISIWTADKSDEEIEIECAACRLAVNRMAYEERNKSLTVTFFDSASPGCWIH